MVFMSFLIKKTQDTEKVMEITKSLGTYFDEDAYNEIESDAQNFPLFGGFIGNIMVGYIIFYEINPQVVEIKWMAVKKDYQNQGLGGKLINKGLKIINQNKNYKICELKTIGEGDKDKKFIKTRKFYLKNGFIPLESLQSFPGWNKNNYVQIFIKCI